MQVDRGGRSVLRRHRAAGPEHANEELARTRTRHALRNVRFVDCQWRRVGDCGARSSLRFIASDGVTVRRMLRCMHRLAERILIARGSLRTVLLTRFEVAVAVRKGSVSRMTKGYMRQTSNRAPRCIEVGPDQLRGAACREADAGKRNCVHDDPVCAPVACASGQANRSVEIALCCMVGGC
eukprot:1018578-Pleurochrysis_carterae.AAC.7